MKTGIYSFRINQHGIVRVEFESGKFVLDSSNHNTILEFYGCVSWKEFFRKNYVKFDFRDKFAFCRLYLNNSNVEVKQLPIK